MALTPASGVAVADDASTFAANLLRLHDDESLWEVAAGQARAHLTHFSREAQTRALTALLHAPLPARLKMG